MQRLLNTKEKIGIRTINYPPVAWEPANKISSGTINGVGTSYYGDWKVTIYGVSGVIKSCFFVIFFIPIIPLRSVIVWDTWEGKGSFRGIGVSGSSNFTASNLKMFRPRISGVYSILLSVISIISLFLIYITGEINNILWLIPIISLIPALLYYGIYRGKFRMRWYIIVNMVVNIIFIISLYFLVG